MDVSAAAVSTGAGASSIIVESTAGTSAGLDLQELRDITPKNANATNK